MENRQLSREYTILLLVILLEEDATGSRKVISLHFFSKELCPLPTGKESKGCSPNPQHPVVRKGGGRSGHRQDHSYYGPNDVGLASPSNFRVNLPRDGSRIENSPK